MDLGLTEEQEILKRIARDFLENECPKALVREMEEDEAGYSPELWRKMAELGWLGLLFPAEYEGVGGNWTDAAVLLEEMGRALLPAPFVSTVILGGLAVMEAGSKEQKERYLGGIARGDTIMTAAITEPEGANRSQFIQAQAKEDGGDYIVSGVKLFVPDANVADYILTAVRTGGASSDDGVTVLIIDTKSAGVKMTPLVSVALDKQSEVAFNNVRVPKANVLGEVGQGWPIVEKILLAGAAATSALMVGSADRVVEMTVSYAKERIQFSRPIGSFQAVQHKCADMVVDLDGAKAIMYQAVWKLAEGLECGVEVSMAKSWVGEAVQRITANANQLHGGLAFSREYDLQLYFRRARAAEHAFGDGGAHRAVIAKQLLG